MKLEDFIDALYKAGWQATTDAQHEKIEKMWRNLFPVVAELEDDLHDLKESFYITDKVNE